MSLFTVSPNMSLTLPSVGLQIGPDWAQEINDDMSLIDSHDHTEGKGAPIPVTALDINADVDFKTHAALSLTLTNFVPYVSQPTRTSSLYLYGVDLYVNDANGNQIRLTQSGSIAGAVGSISGLSAPATASYVAGNATFVWQSDVSTPANMDCGSVIVREVLASANGITLSSPSTLASSYALTLPPALPAAADGILKSSSAGVLSFLAKGAANTLLRVNSGGTALEYSTIDTANITAAAVTKPKLAALGQQISSSCGSFSTTSASFVDVTNLSVTITTTGRPVFIGLIGFQNAASAEIGWQSATTQVNRVNIQFVRDSTVVSFGQVLINAAAGTTIPTGFSLPSSSFWVIDPATLATYTYKVQIQRAIGDGTAFLRETKLIAYEL